MPNTQALSQSNTTLSAASVPKILALVGEFDPPDEIVKPMADFVVKFQEIWNNEGIEFKSLKGHNHVSPIAALMSGDEVGEKWGDELAGWLLGEGVKVEVHESVREILRGPKKKKHHDAASAAVKEKSGKGKENEDVDLNREGGDGGKVGKGESEPKEIDAKEHITPKENGA